MFRLLFNRDKANRTATLRWGSAFWNYAAAANRGRV